MALNSVKKIIRWNWDLIPMSDTVIARINTLGGHRPKIITFTDRDRHLIRKIETLVVGDNSDKGEVEFPGVDTDL